MKVKAKPIWPILNKNFEFGNPANNKEKKNRTMNVNVSGFAGSEIFISDSFTFPTESFDNMPDHLKLSKLNQYKGHDVDKIEFHLFGNNILKLSHFQAKA